MKIRTKLALYYTVTTGLVLLLLSTLIYMGMRTLLFREIDKNLSRLSNSIIASYNPNLAVFGFIEDHFEELSSNPKYHIQVEDAEGQDIFHSGIDPRIELTPGRFSMTKSIGYGDYLIRTVKQSVRFENQGHENIYRFMVKDFYIRDVFIGRVQVADSLDRTFASLRTLRSIFLPAIPFFLILIALVGYYLAKESLSPIQSIIRAADSIRDSNLSERIKQQKSKDEMSKLVNTLNGLFDRLETSFLNQKQFISDAAHELKTPLTILRTSIESMINRRNIDSPTRERLLQNVDTVSRLSMLVEKLLLLSRLENRKVPTVTASVDLKLLLKELQDDMQVLADQKGQKIKLEIMDRIPDLKADRELIFQALFNLLSNALKYSPENESVIIQASYSSAGIIIVVTDHGCGISKKDQEKVFNRFFRTDQARSSEQGYGLGLAITKKIIDLHGGKISLHSTPETGLTVEVFLPLSSAL